MQGSLLFFASAKQWKLRGNSLRGFALLRSFMTAIIFAIVPQRFLTKSPPILPTCGVAYVLFCDEAPCGEGRQFSMGVYLPRDVASFAPDG